MKNKLTPFARKLRKKSTNTERLLWQNLRRNQLCGLKFRRQQPIDKYIVDFVCFEKKIIIELDGGQHAQGEQYKKDIERDEWFEKQEFKILRYWDNEVLTNLEGVLDDINKKISEIPSP